MTRLPRLILAVMLLVPALFALPACGGTAYVIEGSEQVYLLTNLHPDMRRHIHSVNHIQPPGGQLLPMCTPVTIERIRPRDITFTANGVRYMYRLHRSTQAPVEQHVQRYFGGQCTNVQSLSQADQAGIAQGQIFQGMSKQGVILAVGYPPEHQTPSLDGDVWRYWVNRANTIEVYFTNGVVSGIRN